jgi:hypothetical protein
MFAKSRDSKRPDETTRRGHVTSTIAPTRPLSAADRCDRCGAAAYVRVVLDSGELLFCAHHARKYEDKLRAVAVDIHDETGRLVETPSSASDEER